MMNKLKMHSPDLVKANIDKLARYQLNLPRKREPLRAVFRDAGFPGNSVKIKVEPIFKRMSPHTEVKTI